MSEKLRIGIAGYGVVGIRRREFIDKNPLLRTVAVCDRKLGGTGVFPDGVRHYARHQDLLGEELDALFVCLSNDMAAEATVAGLKRGLHVFCEKPPGRNLEEVAAVIAEAKRRPKAKLKYGFNHRYHDSVKDALALIKSGELGTVINLRGVYGKSAIINFESDWRTQRALAGGGILLDQGIHMVDLIRLFAGEFDQVHSFVSNGFWNHDVEDNAYALMRTKSGIVAMLHSTATQWRHRFQLEIALAKGAIVLDGILSGSKSYGAETLTIARAAPGDRGDPRETATRYTEDNSWRDEIDEFADAIARDKPIVNGTAQDALATMELVYRIYCADPEWRRRFALTEQGGREVKIAGFVPARMASSRFPGKPMFKLVGKPMVEHCFRRAALFPRWTGLFLCTCDEEIAAFGEAQGFPTIMTADTHVRALERVAEAVDKSGLGLGDDDVVVCVQADEPMLGPDEIEAVVRPLEIDPKVPGTILAMHIVDEEQYRAPDIVKLVADVNGDVLYTSRAPIPYAKKFSPELGARRIGGIFGFRVWFLRRFAKLPESPLEIAEACDSNRFCDNGYRQRIAPVPYRPYFSVDTPADAALVEAHMRADKWWGKY